MSPNNAQVQHVVTAVIVAHDGAAWIPRVIEALRGQTRQVQRVVAVDTGSRDRSGAMLAEALGRGAVFGMDRRTGYAAAIHQALRHRAANTHVPASVGVPGEPAEWVWLLHDDCEPAPDALEHLLKGAAQAQAVAVAGPKIMDWSDREVLLEAGVGIDRVGRRITGIEPREVDQGQHDGDRDVLAVSSAGMLIRRDVWDEVGGFDPGMLLYREDVDFCWRVQSAGYRVRLVTDAVVYHIEASARNRREASAAPRRGRQDRRDGLLVLLGNLPGGPMLSALVGNLVLSTLRTLFFLLAKRPGAALDEMSAVVGVAGHPLRLLAARRHRSRGRRAAYPHLSAYVPPGRTLRRLTEFARTALSKRHQVDMIGSHHATSDAADEDWLLVDSGLAQRVLTNPGVLLFLALTAIALVAERSLLSTQPLGGGALIPSWGGASGLWSEYLQGFHPAGIGSVASAPPYVAVIAALATLLGGKPWLAVDVILLGCVPLAGLTAYVAAKRITSSTPARIWGAAAYALLPVGMGAVAAGRLGTALVLVLLPLIGITAAGVFTRGPRKARRAAWATGLSVAVAAAFVPLVWMIAVVAMALGAAAFGRGRPAVLINVAIAALVPLFVLFPWSLTLFAHPSRLLLESGVWPPGLAGQDLTARSVLLLSPGGPGLPPYWVTAGLLLAAVVALIIGARRVPVLAGWAVAVLGLLVAAALTKVAVVPPAGGVAVRAWPGPALAFAGAGLVLAVLAASESLRGRLRPGRWRAPDGLAVLVLAAVACTAPALAAAAWVTSGVSGPVTPVAGQVLPEFVSVSSASSLQLRTLVLRAGPNGGVTYSVYRDADPLIGENELITSPAALRGLNLAVAALVAPSGGLALDQGQSLASFGIGYVLLPAPVDAGLARLLDGVPGLRPVSQTPGFQLWRVSGVVARVRVFEPGGAVVPVSSGTVSVAGAKVPAAGGTLVLAEPADGWSASLNGHSLVPLAAPVDGWAQGFHLPAGGGSLTIAHSGLGRFMALALSGLALAVVAVLALPGIRVAGAAEEVPAVTTRARRRRRHGPSQPEHARPDVVPVAAGQRSPAPLRPGSRAPASVPPGSRPPASVPPGSRPPAAAPPGPRPPVPAPGAGRQPVPVAGDSRTPMRPPADATTSFPGRPDFPGRSERPGRAPAVPSGQTDGPWDDRMGPGYPGDRDRPRPQARGGGPARGGDPEHPSLPGYEPAARGFSAGPAPRDPREYGPQGGGRREYGPQGNGPQGNGPQEYRPQGHGAAGPPPKERASRWRWGSRAARAGREPLPRRGTGTHRDERPDRDSSAGRLPAETRALAPLPPPPPRGRGPRDEYDDGGWPRHDQGESW